MMRASRLSYRAQSFQPHANPFRNNLRRHRSCARQQIAKIWYYGHEVRPALLFFRGWQPIQRRGDATASITGETQQVRTVLNRRVVEEVGERPTRICVLARERLRRMSAIVVD